MPPGFQAERRSAKVRRGWRRSRARAVCRRRPPGVSRAIRLAREEDVMFEWNVSSNADWLVAVLLIVAVIAALA
ncbi:MAG TPA: hypothetical protein PLE61_00590 [Vicinamibacterales bacterium]|nr:hypothetical protein [Vicinamibacterales bacterium]HPW19285.1 hypothetical protein [Vicinamibacterales bacterium]